MRPRPIPNWWWLWATALKRAACSKGVTPLQAVWTRLCRWMYSCPVVRPNLPISCAGFWPRWTVCQRSEPAHFKLRKFKFKTQMMLTFFLVMVIAYSFGAFAALAGGRGATGRGLVALGAAAGAGSGLILGGIVMATGMPFALSIPELLPIAGGLALRLDPLGAFFLILIGLVAIPAAIYGAGYSAAYEDGRASLRMLGVMFNLCLLTMSFVPLANNVLTFLLMWEGMSLTSYFLVITESSEEGTLHAGLWYVAMTHAGLVILLSALVLLMNGG